MQAWRLQQETLWFSRAGESHPQLIAVFVLRRDWLLIPVMNSPPPPSPLLCFPFSIGVARGRRARVCVGGVMSHYVLGVVR